MSPYRILLPLTMCLRPCLALFLVSLFAAPAWAERAVGCGSLTNAYGPWDYSNPVHRSQRLPIVETHHFNVDVENLRAGLTGDLALDIDYTLRAFPNHPRALWAMARLQLERTRPPNAKYLTIECYFDRAIRWRPRDPGPWLIYGMYLHRKKDLDGAGEKYVKALELQPENLEAHYNYGLLLAERRQFEQARHHAKLAYDRGYPLPGLRHILERNGHWD